MCNSVFSNGEYDEDDQEFVVSDNAAMDSSSSNSTSSDNLERLSTAEFKQRKRFRKKIKRRHGSEDGSESDKKYSEQSEKSESSYLSFKIFGFLELDTRVSALSGHLFQTDGAPIMH